MVQVSATQRPTGRALVLTVDPSPDDISWLSRSPRENSRGPLTAYLAFDLSGSMSGTPLVEAKKAAHEFIKQIDLSSAAIGVISFADSVSSKTATQDSQGLAAAIESMSIGPVGIGNSATLFADAHQLLRGVDGPRFIVVLTDGVWSFQQRAIQEAKACHADGIEIIAIGFGGADKRFLDAIATSDQRSVFTHTGELVKQFGTIAKELKAASAGISMAPAGGLAVR